MTVSEMRKLMIKIPTRYPSTELVFFIYSMIAYLLYKVNALS